MSSDYPQPYRHDSLSTPTAFSLTMERPRIVRLSLHHKKLNPWSDTMTHEFHAILSTFANDPEVDVILLTGEGPAFCAGLDVTSSSLMSMIDSDDAARSAFALRKHIDEFQSSLTMLERCGKPVIAAVHGVVYGLGIDLMAACDVRFAERGSRFAVREVKIGLAADIGSLQRLPRIIGNDSMARELAYTGREFNSEQAQAMGLLSRVVDGGREAVIAAALAVAEEIAENPPVAVRSTKANLLYSRDHASVQEGLDYVATWNMAMLQSKEVPTAMRAALSKGGKKPTWEKL